LRHHPTLFTVLMEDLPREMINEILSRLDKPNLFQASNVCKLWRREALTQTVTINFGDHNKLAMAARNGDRLSIIRSICDTNYLLLNWGLIGACQGGHRDLAELMITKGARGIDSGLYFTCREGHEELAKLMIIKGAKSFDKSIYFACQRGYEELVNLMIMNGADNFNYGLQGACQGGHKNLIDLMITKGAMQCYCCKSIEEH
jgi:hypothetical protein